MKSSTKRKLLRGGIAAAALAITAGIFVCWFFDIRSSRDLVAYVGMYSEAHPIWKDLALGQIRAGQDLEDVIATTKPVEVHRLGRFVVLQYQHRGYTGVRIGARDGKLAWAEASSCVWSHQFFDVMNEQDMLQFGKEAMVERDRELAAATRVEAETTALRGEK